MKQYPLPTEVIPINTWVTIRLGKRQVRALTTQDSEIVDGVHQVEVMGMGFSGSNRKVIPVSTIAAKIETIGA